MTVGATFDCVFYQLQVAQFNTSVKGVWKSVCLGVVDDNEDFAETAACGGEREH